MDKQIRGKSLMGVENSRYGQVMWSPARVKDLLIDIRAVAERVRAFGETESSPSLTGSIPHRLIVVAAELESGLRSQLALDMLGAHRISKTPAGEEAGNPGYGYIDLELPRTPSFVIYPEPAPIERAAALSDAADTLAHVIAILPDIVGGKVGNAAFEQLCAIKGEIRQYAELLIEN